MHPDGAQGATQVKEQVVEDLTSAFAFSPTLAGIETQHQANQRNTEIKHIFIFLSQTYSRSCADTRQSTACGAQGSQIIPFLPRGRKCQAFREPASQSANSTRLA